MRSNNIELSQEQQVQIVEIMGHPLFTPFPTSVEDSYNFGN